MKKEIMSLEKNIIAIENKLINEALNIKDFNSFYGFLITYIANYIPTLEYIVENLDENKIAKYANFGILIDKLSSIKIDELLNTFIDYSMREISDITKNEPGKILKSLNSLKISQKLQISLYTLNLSSIIRDSLLSQANTKFGAINKITTWSNIFSHFLQYPILHEYFLDNEILNIAEKDLEDSKKIIQSKNEYYDALLAKDWKYNTYLSEKELIAIPKHFVGPKLAWLQAMLGLNIAKILVTKESEYAILAKKYNEKIIVFLKNKNISKSKYAFRERFDSVGPSPDLIKIMNIEKEKVNVSLLDSQSILCISKKRKFVLIVPSNFDFYVNPNIYITRKYKKDNKEELDEIKVPLENDKIAIIEFGKSPAKFFLNCINAVSKPSESNLLGYHIKLNKRIDSFLKSKNSIIGQLELSYGKNINKKVIEAIKNVKGTTMQILFAYGILFSFEKIAEACGLPIQSELWSFNRFTLAAILTNKLNPIMKIFEKVSNEEKNQVRKKIEEVNNFEDKVKELDNHIQKTDDEIKELLKNLKENGLFEIWQTSNEIRKILISGLTIDEITNKLKDYYDSLNEGLNKK